MAIVQEHFEVNGRDFIRTYSDIGVMVHGGFPEADYAEGTDLAELNRTYVETDTPIEPDEATAEELLDILTGESE